MGSSGSSKNVRTIDQVSAGGVAFRRGDDTQIVIIKTAAEKRWQLPKGLIDPGETAETAALREVREETGIVPAMVEPIDSIEYWFYASFGGERARYHKTVHFFLMRYVTGDTAGHDHEVAEARWVSIDEALKMLAFKSEREIVEKARAMIPAVE